MKQKSEKVLLAFTATVSSLMSIPVSDADVIETPDLDLDSLPTDGEISEVTRCGYDLLEAIHSEEPYFQEITEQNRIPLADIEDEKIDRGLKTEINRSTSLVNVSDTLEGCAAVLARHPFGFKNGSRNAKGQVVVKPYTEAENLAAEKWLQSIKNGTPAVVETESDEAEGE